MAQDQGDEDIEFFHKRCGFPIWQDADGNWHHASEGDAAMCELFGDGGMLAPLMNQED